MAENLESALVIVLRETIPWESALDAPASGTLTQVDPAAPINPLDYQYRDRQLAHRDLITAAAIVEVSMEVSDVWNYQTTRPRLQGPAITALPFADSEFLFEGTHPTVTSQVRHVGQTSVPYAAFHAADKDLYARDLIIYEVLARASEEIFSTSPPITTITTQGTIPSTAIWSLAEGTHAQRDINTAHPLNRDLFKLPDQNLADRDNQLAGYAARVVAALRNPFVAAERLYVRLRGLEEREPEVYVFQRNDWISGDLYQQNEEVFYLDQFYRALFDGFEPPSNALYWLPLGNTPGRREYLMEPTLARRNRIVYDVDAQTLQWSRESTDLLHIPQLFAFSIPSIVDGQVLDTLAQVPEEKDVMFWRLKAGQIVPVGFQQIDVTAVTFTANDSVEGGYTQREAASLTVPDTLNILFPGAAVQNGNYRVSVLVEPSPVVEIIGAQNISGTSGTLAGATFQTNVSSGNIQTGVLYIVQGGSGTTYNGIFYRPGDTFTGLSGVTSHSPLDDSQVRQLSLAFRLALPRGTWSMRMDYANLAASVTGFGVKMLYSPQGRSAISILEDTVPLPYMDENGDPLPIGTLVTSQEFGFDIADGNEFTLPITWTSTDGQLHIRQLTFTRTDQVEAFYDMSGTLGIGQGVGSFSAGAHLAVNGKAFMPDVMTFDFTNTGSIAVPINFSLSLTNDTTIPLQVKQVQIQTIGTYTPTPASESFQGFRQEMIDRVERICQQSFNRAVEAYGTRIPEFRSTGSVWSQFSTEEWMAFMETKQPRLREIATIAGGNLIPNRQYEVTVGPVTYDSVSYDVGDKFTGVEDETTYTGGGTISQVGCFLRGGPGHIGKPAILPLGLEFDFIGGTVNALEGPTRCCPNIVALMPWMLDIGVYVAGPELWMPDQLIAVPKVEIEELLSPDVRVIVTDSGSMAVNLLSGSQFIYVNEDATASAVGLFSGSLILGITDSGTMTDFGTHATSLFDGTYFSVIASGGTMVDTGTHATSLYDGTYFSAVISSGTMVDTGTHATSLYDGTYVVTAIASGTYSDAGTHSVGFFSGTLS